MDQPPSLLLGFRGWNLSCVQLKTGRESRNTQINSQNNTRLKQSDDTMKLGLFGRQPQGPGPSFPDGSTCVSRGYLY